MKPYLKCYEVIEVYIEACEVFCEGWRSLEAFSEASQKISD
jgi:hypothetical protein